MSRPPLILCPGLLNDHGLWQGQVEDLGGVAEISVADVAAAASLAEIAARILAAGPPSFALAGLSMGGYVCFEILRQAPDRVSRLALFDTTADPETEETRARRLAAMELAKGGAFERVWRLALPNLVDPANAADRAIAGVFGAMAGRVGVEGYLRQQQAILGRPDSRPLLARIACPTLVAGGAHDLLTPPSAMAALAKAIPGARHEIIPGAGHLPPLERPAHVSALIRHWLSV